jgi:hypothetical protein
MFRRPKTDFWQVGVVPAPAEGLMESGALSAARNTIAWLPQPGPWAYRADPFGLTRRGSTHVFVEAFDYHTKHAVIEHHELTPSGAWRGGDVVLVRPFHLSYPFIVEQGGDVFMVPESHQAGEVALYRALAFPQGWVRETVLLADAPAAEPSLIQYDGQWWMFFTVVGRGARDQRELHIAFATQLTGPWTLHPQNPVRIDKSGARPGGTPIIGADGSVILPVQDCSRTYGGAVRFLKFSELTQTRVSLAPLPATLTGDLVSGDHAEGLHTFSSCGPVTLIDVKRIDRSRKRGWVDLKRRMRKPTQIYPSGYFPS